MQPTSLLESDSFTVSVIIASYNARALTLQCLHSIIPQAEALGAEVIVVDSSSDGTDQLIRQSFPSIMLYHFHERKYLDEAKNIGVSHATGDIVAFIDGDCIADPNRLENIIAAHKDGYEIVGGAVLNNPDNSLVGWAYYFVEFSRWMPRPAGRVVSILAGGHTSYSRAIFHQRSFSTSQSGTKFCGDTIFHAGLRHSGKQLYFCPSIIGYHLYPGTSRQFLLHVIQHGFDSGKALVQSRAFSPFLMIVLILLGPFLPLMKVWLIVWRTLRNGTMIKELFAVFPLVVLGSTCWMVGEWVGYVRGFFFRKQS